MGNWAKFWGVLAAGIATVCILGAAWKHGFFSSEIAAWAQAIGTIAAIWATATLARRQEVLATRRREAERVRFIQMVVDTVGLAAARLEDVIRAVEAKDRASLRTATDIFREAAMAQTLRELAEVPLERWPDVGLALVYRELNRTTTDYVNHCVRLCGSPPTHHERLWPVLAGAIDGLRDTFRLAIEVASDVAETPSTT